MAIIICSYFLASYLYLGDPLAPGQLVNIRILSWRDSGILFLIAYSLFLILGYAATRVFGSIYLGRIRKMAKSVALVNLFGLVLFMSTFYIFNLDDASRVLVFLFFVFSTVFVCFANWVSIHLFRIRRNSQKYRRNVLVIGSGHLAQEYAEAVGSRSSRFEHVIGFIAPSSNTISNYCNTQSSTAAVHNYLGPCLGTILNIEYVLQTHQVDEIVLALDVEDYSCVRQAVGAADRHGVALTLVPFYNDLIPRKPNIDSFGGINLVDLRSMPLSNPLYASLKRFSDIVVSLIAIILTSWLMLITAIGVKLSSPGPSLFKQVRVGRYNKPFEILKFRSMVVNDRADSAQSAKSDPRRTRFGSFIRKYSIDELPQFFNVLIGDMSIVGPRPLMYSQVQEHDENITHYMLRHQVRPGITGLAQISGYRGETQENKRIQCDIYYIQHWSFWLDIKIFFKTMFGGFANDENLADVSIENKFAGTKIGDFLCKVHESAAAGSLAAVLSAIYLSLTFVYVFFSLYENTYQYDATGLVLGVLSSFAIVWIPYAMILLGLITWICEGRKPSFWILAIVCLFAAFAMSWHSGINYLVSMYAFIFAYPKSMDLKKAAIAIFVSTVLSITVISISSIVGLMPDVHRKGAGIIRHSMGFETPGTFAMKSTICFVPYMYFRLHRWKWFDTVLCLVFGAVVYFIAQDKLAAVMMLFMLVFAYMFKVRKTRYITSRIAPWAFIGCFTICALIVFLYCQNPNVPFTSSMDRLFGGRLSDFRFVLSELQINMFGNNLQTMSIEGNSFELTNAIAGLDCSYLSILLRFGIIGSAILMFPTIWMGIKSENEKYYSAVFVILVLAIFSITENIYCYAVQNFCIFIMGFFLAKGASAEYETTGNAPSHDFDENQIDYLRLNNSRWSDFLIGSY